MSNLEKTKVTKNVTAILEDVSAGNILPYLEENGVVTDNDIERIRNTVTRREKVQTLLNILPNRGPNAYKHFLNSLEEDYPWLVECIENTEVDSEVFSKSETVPKELNHKLFSVLSKHMDVLVDWKHFGRCLNLAESDIIDIDYSSRHVGPAEAAYQCLLRWKTRNGNRATYGVLVERLNDMGYKHLASTL